MSRSRSARRWSLAGVLLLAGLLASGCTADDLPRFGWPSGVTDRAKDMQHFWSWTCIVALAVGVLVWGLMFWTFTFHRKKKNSPLYPKQTKENLPLEIIYSVVPFVMVLVLFYFAVTTQDSVTKNDAKADVTIHVTAQKWAWDFGYAGTTSPNPASPTTSLKVADYVTSEVHTVGTPGEVPILVLPVHRVIEYHLESADVIHSFWVVPFLFKRDVFPDPAANNTVNVIQNTIEQTGAFVGRCAEFCGTYHSAMNFEVRAVPGDVYDAYLVMRQKVDPATGLGYTAAAALTAVGNQFPGCGELCAPRATSTVPFATNRQAAKGAAEAATGGNR